MNKSVRQRQANNPCFRMVDFILYNEQAIKTAVYHERNDHKPNYKSRKPAYSDPTATEAIYQVEPLRNVILPTGEKVSHPEKWLEWTVKLYRAVNELQYALIISRYKERELYCKFCKKNGVSQATYNNLLRDIRIYGVLIAVDMDLISAEKFFKKTKKLNIKDY